MTHGPILGAGQDNPDDDLFGSWSPDGNKIAFRRGMDENSDIYAMNSDGSEQIRLTNNPDYDGHPAWSPFLKTEK